MRSAVHDNEIDNALREQQTWDPPPGFAERVVRLSRTSRLEPAPVTFRATLRLLPSFLHALAMDTATALAGATWTIRQYWSLIGR